MVKVKVIDEFKRQFKHLYKKYKSSIIQDYEDFVNNITANPYAGADLGAGVHKVRMAITAKKQGKSGGARVITYVVQNTGDEVTVTLLSIYDKSEMSSVSDKYINYLLDELNKQK